MSSLRIELTTIHYVDGNDEYTNPEEGEFCSSQAGDHSLGDSFSDGAEEMLQRSIIFRTILYFVRTKNIKSDRGIFLQDFEKDRLAHAQ